VTNPAPAPPPGPGPTHFPAPWASDWGEDRFGLWQALTYRGARQAFRWCPPGSFLMGSPPDEHERFDTETQHEVTLTRGLWMADTACTQALWEAVTGQNPSRFKGARRPVEQVTWYDAEDFIQSLDGIIDAQVDRLAARRRSPFASSAIGPGPEEQPVPLRLRLPTEAEWEYACRAGTRGPFAFGDDIDPDQANYDGNHPYRGRRKGRYREETVEVASLPPNPWGLYEVHGNVWEWCRDWYGEYPGGPVTDPVGPPSGGVRVLRGGSWLGDARYLRSAYRFASPPAGRNVYRGLRLALGPELGPVGQGGQAGSGAGLPAQGASASEREARAVRPRGGGG